MQNNIYSKTAKYAFLILLFFTILGTGLPFGEREVDPLRMTGSNIINQLLYGGLFIVAVIILLPRKNELFTIIKREKFLSFFIAFAL